MNLPHFHLTAQVFLQLLYFYFELHLLATILLFFTSLWLDLTVTVPVHFPQAQTNVFNYNISFQTRSDSYRECLEESLP